MYERTTYDLNGLFLPCAATWVERDAGLIGKKRIMKRGVFRRSHALEIPIS